MLRPSAAGDGKVQLSTSDTPTSDPENSGMTIVTDNPMPEANVAHSRRCGARTRSGTECRSPAVRGRRRCRMHGGTNPGPPKGNRNAWKHGNRSAEAEEQLKIVRAADRDLRILSKVMQGLDLRPKEKGRLIQLQNEERALRSRKRAMLAKCGSQGLDRQS
jgi:hypothetical protein